MPKLILVIRTVVPSAKGTVTHGRQFTFALGTTVLSAHGVDSN